MDKGLPEECRVFSKEIHDIFFRINSIIENVQFHGKMMQKHIEKINKLYKKGVPINEKNGLRIPR